MQRRLPLGPIIVALLLVPAIARAQAPDPQRAAAAQALFEQANEEMEKKRYSAACPKLEEVTRLVPDALGARMALAECYEGIGKLASAWSAYAMVEGLAAKANQAERAATAGKRAADLKPRLATLTIDLAGGLDAISGLTITRDGVDVGKAQWGVAFPVDVGPHQISAVAPGYQPWKKSIEVIADGAGVALKIPMLRVDPAGPRNDAPAPAARPWQRPLAVGALAAGGVSVAVGALLGGLAIAKNKESNRSACNAHNQCTEAGLALRGKALALGTGSTATVVIGGVLAAGGLALLLTAPKDKAPPKAGSAEMMIGLRPGFVSLEGVW
jgi:tetratricopeptide (TPR) repeat protein